MDGLEKARDELSDRRAYRGGRQRPGGSRGEQWGEEEKVARRHDPHFVAISVDGVQEISRAPASAQQHDALAIAAASAAHRREQRGAVLVAAPTVMNLLSLPTGRSDLAALPRLVHAPLPPWVVRVPVGVFRVVEAEHAGRHDSCGRGSLQDDAPDEPRHLPNPVKLQHAVCTCTRSSCLMMPACDRFGSPHSRRGLARGRL